MKAYPNLNFMYKLHCFSGKQEAYSAEVGALAQVSKKTSTKPKPKLLRDKKHCQHSDI